MQTYAKAVAAFCGSISAWGIGASPDGISGVEWFGLLGVLGTTILVAFVPNKPADT